MSDISETNTARQYRFGLKSLFSAGGLAILFIILLLANLIVSRLNLRWDITEEKLFSLSKGTVSILANLQEKVTLKVFYTADLINTPLYIKNYAQRVRDFIGEYEKNGKGKIKVEFYNPAPDSEEEEWALKYGVEGLNLPSGERMFFGLVATAADLEETMKMLDPSKEDHLEYDITRMITKVQSPEKRKIGIISSLPVFGAKPQYNPQSPSQGSPACLFVTELKKTYDVREISPTAESIEEGLDLLFVIHPKGLSETLQYEIDQYVLSGKNAIVMADPFCFAEGNPDPRRPAMLPKKLLDAWGVNIESNRIIVDYDYATELMMRNNTTERNPTWLSPAPEAFNSENLITSKLERMLFPAAGAITKKADSPWKTDPLLITSKNSSLDDTFKLRFGSSQFSRDFSPTIDQYNIAVQITGKFKTAFIAGKPKSDSEKETGEKTVEEIGDTGNHLAEAKKETTVIVIADADFLYDDFYVRKQNLLGFNMTQISNDNLNFLLNSCEMLTGSNELISIRSRGKFGRPFTKVQELEKTAQAQWMEKEKKLAKQVEETNRKLQELERKKDPSQKYFRTAEQEQEIQRFRDEKIKINKELKEVRKNLRRDTERLGRVLAVTNIGLMPFLVILCGVGYGLYRRARGQNS